MRPGTVRCWSRGPGRSGHGTKGPGRPAIAGATEDGATKDGVVGHGRPVGAPGVQPTGLAFLSYRQPDGLTVATELAWLLRAASVPVWHDRTDLPTTCTRGPAPCPPGTSWPATGNTTARGRGGQPFRVRARTPTSAEVTRSRCLLAQGGRAVESRCRIPAAPVRGMDAFMVDSDIKPAGQDRFRLGRTGALLVIGPAPGWVAFHLKRFPGYQPLVLLTRVPALSPSGLEMSRSTCTCPTVPPQRGRTRSAA